MRAARASTWYLRRVDRRELRRDRLHHLVPEHHRVAQRVRLGRAGQHLARPARRRLEAVAHDALDAAAREHRVLQRHLVRRSRRRAGRPRRNIRPRRSRARTPCRCRRRRGRPGGRSRRAAAASAAGSRIGRSAAGWAGSAPRPRCGRARRACPPRPGRSRRRRGASRARPCPSCGRCCGRSRSPRGSPSSPAPPRPTSPRPARMERAAGMTSRPMPSPAMTAMRCRRAAPITCPAAGSGRPRPSTRRPRRARSRSCSWPRPRPGTRSARRSPPAAPSA